MPFFDDTGINTELGRGPFWGTFATLRDQIERLLALNIVWSAQLLPGVAALGFGGLPAWMRALMLLYSGAVLAPATGLLYALVRRAAEGETLTLDLTRDLAGKLALPSLRALGSLLGAVGLLLWMAAYVGSLGIAWSSTPLLALEVALRLLLLLLLACAMYWGPLLAEQPSATPASLARQAARLVWRYPGHTLLVSGAVLLTLVVGAISVGGLFLIVPVLVALLQTHMYLEVKDR
jgi:hypothetical protein